MKPKTTRTTEAEISLAVLKILSATSGGRASYRKLVEEVPLELPLSAVDLKFSKSRPNERLWEQRLRNIKSHYRVEGNYINDGYLVPVSGGLEITEVGRAKLRRLGFG